MRQIIYLNTIIAAIFVLCSCRQSVPDSIISCKREIYKDKAKVAPVFIALNPGDVIPEGWIKDWAQSAAKGITGHLDEDAATFGEGWKGKPFEAMGAGEDGTGWPLEQCSYWLDGSVRLAYILKDTALINKVSKRLDYIVDGVLKGGDSFIYWKKNAGILTDTARIPKENSPADFNNWAHSHMGRALVAYYQATYDKRILQALVKVYKQFPAGDLWYDFETVSGACNIDAMTETYLMSGDKTILDSIISFSNRVSYKSVADRWSHGDLTPGHDVVYYEDIRIPALIYPWTGNKTDLNASLNAIEWGEKRYLLPSGLCSGEEWHSGIGATRNVETCNVAASEWTFLWMLRITGNKSFSDRIEKIFFNAAPAVVDREFNTMSYFTCPNRYSSMLPGEGPRAIFTRLGLKKILCCVGNLNRIIPNYIMNMWMATMDEGLAATLYGPCKVQARIADNISVGIDCQTSYPFEELINMTVYPEKDIEFPLYLRVPEWCKNPEIKINGIAIDAEQEGSEFIRVSRIWKKNDKITLHFPMNVKVVKGRETPFPQISYFDGKIAYFDEVRKIAKDTTINNPYECVYYGPLLFSLPIPDESPDKEASDAGFNYALDVDPDSVGSQISVIRREMPALWNWSVDAPIQLSARAREFDWKPSENQPIPADFVTGGKEVHINLVPYGCTKFRVTMFPVADKKKHL